LVKKQDFKEREFKKINVKTILDFSSLSAKTLLDFGSFENCALIQKTFLVSNKFWLFVFEILIL
jgi:hypothetical protein